MGEESKSTLLGGPPGPIHGAAEIEMISAGGMRSVDLRAVLRCHRVRRYYKTVEVLALNEIPHEGVRQARPALYIVNSEPNFGPGAHWVLVCLRNNNPPEFFDPLGCGPSEYSKQLVNFLKCNSLDGSYETSVAGVQRDGSALCGAYCLLYALVRSVHSSLHMKDICNSLRKMSELDMLFELGSLIACS